MHYLNVLAVSLVSLMSFAGLSTASMAGIHDVARHFNGNFARGDKETVTVTVTSIPESCAAATGKATATPTVPESVSQPVVVVPGTQSETATYNVPGTGATITPGAPAPVVSPAPSKGTPSGTASIIPTPSSANATTGANIPIPVGSTGALKSTQAATSTTTAVESSTTTASETSTETAPSGTATGAAPSTPVAASPNTGNKSFAGIFVVVMAALTGSVALLA